MNSTEHSQHRSSFMNRLMKWPLLCGLMSFTMARPVLAADALYENDATVNYPGNTNNPPQIDATNFVNNGSFIINYTVLSAGQPFFETSDTVNYTNIGSMEANTGFQFDNYSTADGSRIMSGNFYNAGLISCGFSQDVLDFGGLGVFLFPGFGQCLVTATNIINSGTVNAGADGKILFSGQNVDLSRGTLTIGGTDAGQGRGANASGSGIFGLNTNLWDPSFELSSNAAGSASFLISPFFLNLTNSTAFIQTNSTDGGSNNLIQAVFVQDTSFPNVSYQVFLTGAIGDDAAIQWAGSYVDAASGISYTNYLSLLDNGALVNSTNIGIVFNGGYPDNFTFFQSSAPLFFGSNNPAGFLDVFPPVPITNSFSFANVQFVSTSVSATLNITNLPGRVNIYAANELDLSFAQITGANYLSIQATNQFDGSAGAFIQAPYADISVGVTNGFLTMSNLTESSLPNWSGNVEAWSTRWVTVNSGVTNDYRVLIVGSQLNPTTVAQVQDLFLHGTNSIVISDTYNITRNFTADAQNLTLTTNGVGVGATSLEGELNLNNNSAFFFQDSLPNLLNLTNNGAIRTLNQASFGSPFVVSITPSTNAVTATGILSEAGTNAVRNDKIIIGTNQYVFVKTPTNSIANQVKIGTSFDSTMTNLIAAINGATGSGTVYSTATSSNRLAGASLLTSHFFTVTARTNGSAGNTVATLFVPATSSKNFTWNAQTNLVGGLDFIPAVTNVLSFPYNNFINNGLISDQGSTIYANNFVNAGIITNGINSFKLKSLTASLNNGSLIAMGDVAITADSLVASNLVLQAGRSLTLQVTNVLTDTGVINGNAWSVGGSSSAGLNLPIKPVLGDLLGTTIVDVSPTNKIVANVWAGHDYGISTIGYTNNAAVGRLIIDSFGPPLGKITFNGTGTNNALYVDYLEFRDQATNFDAAGNPLALTNGSNLVIYYAEAVVNGTAVSAALNHKNNDHLRWVSAYAGYFSSTNLVVGGITNVVNAGLLQSTNIDSDGDGIPNAFDSTPFFTPGQVDFTLTVTNVPPLKVKIQWQTIPSATNYILYKTNLLSSNWLTLTNFVTPAAPPYAPITNTIFDTVGSPDLQRYYRVQINPNTTTLFGP
jgi:hypothetical protein